MLFRLKIDFFILFLSLKFESFKISRLSFSQLLKKPYTSYFSPHYPGFQRFCCLSVYKVCMLLYKKLTCIYIRAYIHSHVYTRTYTQTSDHTNVENSRLVKFVREGILNIFGL